MKKAEVKSKKPARPAKAKVLGTKKTVAVTKVRAAKKSPPARGRQPARGRPTGYTKALGEKICALLVQNHTLRQIEVVRGMPTRQTICNWLAKHQDFFDQYVRAREVQTLLDEDEIQELADDSRNDWVERERKGKVGLELDREHLERTRLRIDTKKWLMGKRNAKRFGKSVALTGKDGGAVKHEVSALRDVLDAINGAGTGLPGDDRDD